MRKVDIIRTKLGLENYRWLRIDARGAGVLPALDPAKAIGTGGSQIEIKQAAKPANRVLRQFKPKEAESKQRDPRRPLPTKGDFEGYTLNIPAEDEQIFLPLLITGEREDGCYLKVQLDNGTDVRLFIITAETEEAIYLDIEQGENSHLHMSIVEQPGYPSWQLLSYRVNVAANATLKAQSLNLESSAYHVGQIELSGEGAEAYTMAATFVDSYEEIRVDTSVVHRAGQSTSFIYNHGVVKGEGYGMFAGRTHIIKGAAGSNGDQESRFLTLDDTAHADVYPVLLIDENDLVAGHAASVGQLDESALYYLQSRGLSREQAQRLVTSGYLQPVIDAISGSPEAPTQEAGVYLRETLLEKVSQ